MISKSINPGEKALTELLTGQLFASVRSPAFCEAWMSGFFPPVRSRALLALSAARGERTDELIRIWHAIRTAEKTAVSFRGCALDTCGTGGDGSHSLNLSTISALVMAAAGVTVIKHGNRAITSRCGSSDLLLAFGMKLDNPAHQTVKSAQQCGMGYFHAPTVHPVYARFHPLRKSLKIRTFFNLLGPILNPVAVRSQLLGVSKQPLLQLYAGLLPKIGRKSALIFQGAEGMDEITTLGPSQGLQLSGSRAKNWILNPKQFQFKKGRKNELEIKSIAHARRKAIEVLRHRQPGTALDSVLLNAACGIWIAGQADSVAAGLKRARQALASGRAWAVLNQMIQLSNS